MTTLEQQTTLEEYRHALQMVLEDLEDSGEVLRSTQSRVRELLA